MRSLKKRGPHVLDDLMTSYFPYTSTYGILITAIERYIAVIYPIWYNVRTIEKHFSNTAQWHCGSHSRTGKFS